MSAGTAVPGLDADTALDPVGPLRWRGAVSERWWIGRGPFGGYLAAFLTRALVAAVEDPWRPPRSLSVHFVAAPAAGAVEVAATVERVGRSATSVALRMEQDGRPVALGLGAAGAWRDDQPTWGALRAPEVPPPDACPPLPPGLAPFFDNFDVRAASGELGAPSEEAANATWVRARPGLPLDHLTVTALADTMVPAAFSHLGRPVLVPTVDLTVHFRAPLVPADDDGWGLAAFRSRLSTGGMWDEDGELWSRAGVLLAQSRQLALIRDVAPPGAGA